MTKFPVSEVRRNNSNGQKLVTVPKDSDIQPGAKVMMINLGQHWESIPGYLKTHQLIRDLVTLSVNSTQHLGSDLEDLDEVYPHMEDAGDALSKALSVIEDNRAVYADISTEELQENCEHETLNKEDEGWRCQDCKKVLDLS